MDTFVLYEDNLPELPADFTQNYFSYRNEPIFFKVGEPLIDASDISYKGTKVQVGSAAAGGTAGEIFIVLDIKPKSQSKFAEITNKYYQKRLAICLDNIVVSAPEIASRNIREPIITGEFTKTEADELVKILRAGPLPVSLDLKSQLLVSPSLGKEIFHKGLLALAIGIGFVTVLLFLSYVDHIAMLVAFVICMILQGMLLFIFGRMGWITLNMISLSGLVVLIGISVDNLILIFEELRTIILDESKDAYTQNYWLMMLNQAFHNEKGIILLANITTIITLVPLYYLQGPITDLVMIMVLGIIVAVIINVWFAGRLLVNGGFISTLEKVSPLPRPLLQLRFSLFSFSRSFLILYLCAVIISVFLLVNRGVERGLDFKGGTEIKLFSDQGIGTDNLRSYASEYFGERCEVKRIKASSSIADESFQYIIRVPGTDDLPAENTGESYPEGAENSNRSNRVAEKFVGYLNDKAFVPVRIGSVDVLGSTVVLLNQRVVIFSACAGLLLLSLFIGFAYGFSYPIPVIMALILDGLIVLGAISLFHVPLSIAVVAAVLTVIGYSINDSIVICGHIHRVSQNVNYLTREEFTKKLNTLSSRVILTTATTAGVAASLWIFGEGIIRDFGLVITIGAIFGTISSVSLVTILLKYIRCNRN